MEQRLRDDPRIALLVNNAGVAVSGAVTGGDPDRMEAMIQLNIVVGVFNLLPLLPLDGGHIAVNLYERVRDWVRKLRGKPAGAIAISALVPPTASAAPAAPPESVGRRRDGWYCWR